jgi:hypothetical protein
MSIMINATKNISIKSSIVIKVSTSEMILSVSRGIVKSNLKMFALALFLLLPMAGFAQKPIKASKKAKVVKTIKRNILDIEFGTFNYSSPFLSKKSTFIG